MLYLYLDIRATSTLDGRGYSDVYEEVWIHMESNIQLEIRSNIYGDAWCYLLICFYVCFLNAIILISKMKYGGVDVFNNISFYSINL
jgi:hypothetical protein